MISDQDRTHDSQHSSHAHHLQNQPLDDPNEENEGNGSEYTLSVVAENEDETNQIIDEAQDDEFTSTQQLIQLC